MRFSWVLAVMSSLVGLTAARAAPLEEGFVRREGSRLMLDGRSIHFNGANQYYVFYKSRAMTDELLEDAAALGLNVLRTWAFCNGGWHDGHCLQPAPRVYHEPTFEKLDYAIYRAEQLGIRLVFSLVNNWDDFGGMNTYVEWSETAREHDDFYSDPGTRALYKDYVSYVLNRRNTLTGRAYKDEPAILMWELANEPRVAKSRAGDFYAWIDEMAGHIKSIDSKHLVSTGSEGGYDTDLVATHRSPHVDVVSFHLYPEAWSFSEEQSLAYIQEQIRTAKEELRKPVFCGEFGIRDKGARDRIYRAWYDAFQAQAIDGAMFWLLSGHQDDGSLYPDFDGFTVYHPESASTTRIIEEHSGWTRARSGRPLDLVAPRLTVDDSGDGGVARGIVELRGTVEDDHAVKSVAVSLGGVYRPATVEAGAWRYAWDSREALDGRIEVSIRASDAEDNLAHQSLRLDVANDGYRSGLWRLEGHKEQDDGYNFVYALSALNETGRVEQGHFAVRFFLRPEGALRVGAHYDQSQVYRRHPTVSALREFHEDVRFIELDLGVRSVGPREHLGLKGQLSQSDGGLKTSNDWSAGELPARSGPVARVLWLKDGQVIGGSAP
jgi:mannan endo-1,4-beta-mannosidase